MYKSRKQEIIAFKYFIPIFGIVWIALLLYLIIDTHATITINGIVQKANFNNSWPSLFSAIFLAIPYFLIGRFITYVEMNNKSIRIRNNKEYKEVPWDQIESISLVTFLLPTIYRIRIRGEEQSWMFSSGGFAFIIPFFSWDLSEMGAFIKKKKKEYDL